MHETITAGWWAACPRKDGPLAHVDSPLAGKGVGPDAALQPSLLGLQPIGPTDSRILASRRLVRAVLVSSQRSQNIWQDSAVAVVSRLLLRIDAHAHGKVVFGSIGSGDANGNLAVCGGRLQELGQAQGLEDFFAGEAQAVCTVAGQKF